MTLAPLLQAACSNGSFSAIEVGQDLRATGLTKPTEGASLLAEPQWERPWRASSSPTPNETRHGGARSSRGFHMPALRLRWHLRGASVGTRRTHGKRSAWRSPCGSQLGATAELARREQRECREIRGPTAMAATTQRAGRCSSLIGYLSPPDGTPCGGLPRHRPLEPLTFHLMPERASAALASKGGTQQPADGRCRYVGAGVTHQSAHGLLQALGVLTR